MFSGRVAQCYDSHVHWLATGEVAEQLQLNQLKCAEDVGKLKPEAHNFRGDWLLGFGWDQNLWPGQSFPNRDILDQVFGPETPVAFSRADGHATWVNTAALKRAQIFDTSIPDPAGGRIVRDASGFPTGILIDTAMRLIDQHFPPRTDTEVRRALLRGMKVFNQAGFTHIRDLSCSSAQWQQSLRLEASGLLTLAVEQYFSVEEGQTFESALQLALKARQYRSRLLRVKGIKVFVDGALGSEGAWLSQHYSSGSGHGLELLPMADLKNMMSQTWAHGLDLAVHTIGDQAAHETVLAFHELSVHGIRGRLHLEHAEMLRPETIDLMKGHSISCHMQPCHWLSDHRWLESKVGDLKRFAFPWRSLQEAGIAFDFGSDSPIERPSLIDNFMALSKSADAGVPKLIGDPLSFQTHPDAAWVPNCYSIFADGIPVEVIFAGQHLQ